MISTSLLYTIFHRWSQLFITKRHRWHRYIDEWCMYLCQRTILCWHSCDQKKNQVISSAVTIIVVTIFIATFQNYRIVFLSWYFLCVRNDIFARYLRYANMIDSPPVYSSFSFNHVPRTTWRVIAARRPWLSSVSVRERRRNCLWSNVSLVVSAARAVFMTSQLTITSVCLRCRFQVSVLSLVSMGN